MQNRRNRGPSPIQDALKTFLRERGLTAPKRDARTFRAWESALGVRLSKKAEPVRFQRGELTVEVESSAHLQELKNFTGEGYRERANEILQQPDAIRRVVFKLRSQ